MMMYVPFVTGRSISSSGQEMRLAMEPQPLKPAMAGALTVHTFARAQIRATILIQTETVTMGERAVNIQFAPQALIALTVAHAT